MMMEQIKTLKWVFLLQENMNSSSSFRSKMGGKRERGKPWSCPYD